MTHGSVNPLRLRTQHVLKRTQKFQNNPDTIQSRMKKKRIQRKRGLTVIRVIFDLHLISHKRNHFKAAPTSYENNTTGH